MKNRISYSDVLIEYITPLLDGTEYLEDLEAKVKFGMVAWNYHVSDQNDLPLDAEMKAILKMMTMTHQEGRKKLNEMVLRKEQHFSQYNQYIATAEVRQKPDGSVTVYVESAPADKVKKAWE
ncbi:MAG: hypothetical protein AAGA62_10110 [Bacteroidota bacterium]